MDEFPKALYRFPGAEPMHGGFFALRTVADADEEAAALAEGWSLSTVAAKAAHDEAKAAAAAEAAAQIAAALKPDLPKVAGNLPESAENLPPTREELEQKATELGIKFDGRWGDKKLRDAIEAALKA